MLGVSRQQQAEHAAAAIRANVRDARILEVLSMTDEAREQLRVEQIERVLQSSTAAASAVDRLNAASATVLTSLSGLGSAAKTSRATILAAAQEALVLLEVQAQDARVVLAREVELAREALAREVEPGTYER